MVIDPLGSPGELFLGESRRSQVVQPRGEIRRDQARSGEIRRDQKRSKEGEEDEEDEKDEAEDEAAKGPSRPTEADWFSLTLNLTLNPTLERIDTPRARSADSTS